MSAAVLPFAMPIAFAFFMWLLIYSIVTKKVPASLNFPEFQKSTKPAAYYLSLGVLFALAGICGLGMLDQTFNITLF